MKKILFVFTMLACFMANVFSQSAANGNHFFTDVLTGALIGTICGFAVPYYHTKNIGTANIGKAKAAVSPVGFNMKIEF